MGMARLVTPKKMSFSQKRKVFSRLMKYLGESKLLFFTTLACVTLTVAGTIAASYMIKPVINVIAEVASGGWNTQRLIERLLPIVLYLALVYVVQSLVQYLQKQLSLMLSKRVLYKLRNDLFEKMQRLDISFYGKYTHGEIMSRFINDTSAINELFSSCIEGVFSSLFTIVGILAVMLILSPLLTLVTVGMLPIAIVAVLQLTKRSRKNYRMQQKVTGELSGFIEEMLQGESNVKAFCMEDRVNERFQSLSKELRTQAERVQTVSGMVIPVMQNISVFIYVLTALFAGLLCVYTGLDIGTAGAFINISRQVTKPLNELANQLSELQTALASGERIFEIMDMAGETGGALTDEAAFSEDIRLKNAVFSYDGKTTVINHVDFTIERGSRVALIGSTGCGKTTIANLLNRFYRVSGGAITFGGRNIAEFDLPTLRKNVVSVLQDTYLFAGSVIENIRYGNKEATDEECVAAAKTVNAHAFILRLKDGYDTVLSLGGEELSQGERQLLNLARIAVCKPKVLILDEATSSVDTRTEEQLKAGLQKLTEGKTCLIIAHRLSTVKNCDKIIKLRRGEVERETRDMGYLDTCYMEE